MNRYRIIALSFFILCVSGISINSYGDTIDIWSVRLNETTIINSNENEIMADQPMELKLYSFNDTDSVSIVYWTDTGIQEREWSFIFKDSTNRTIETFTNPIDFSEEQITRKNYITYSVAWLRKLLQNENIKIIYVEFNRNDFPGAYRNKKICIITNDK